LVEEAVAAFRPDCIVNCAAYNLVDRAESELVRAHQVNVLGPRILAEAARKHGARMVHFGSDYVFDGEKSTALYTESDRTAPLNAYGRSKLDGELAVQEVLEKNALILRLSWVFGQGTQNFIWKFLDQVDRGAPLAATYDEFSAPTWTGTVVAIALAALEQGLHGLFHLTNSGYCSRFEWARLILKARGIDRYVRPAAMASFGLAARRPVFSAMSNAAIAHTLNVSIPSWEETVAAFVKREAGA
jgi:dTDP-4-dehydrorhamnose reductase